MSLGSRQHLAEGQPLDETPIDDELRAKFLVYVLGVLGEVVNANTADELVELGDELQSAGLVLRGELDLQGLLG